MKKIIFTLLVFHCLLFKANAQSNWIWLNPTPTRNELRDVNFLNSLSGYTVGTNGTVLKTTNGGYNWFNSNYYKQICINSVLFFNNDTGIILSDNHFAPYYTEIIRTTNGGLNWNVVLYAYYIKVNKIYFINQFTGFAICGDTWTNFKSPLSNIIYKTTNQGLNWQQISIGYSFVMNSISFKDLSTGVIAGSDGTIIKTTNSGENWFQIKSGSETYNDILFKGNDTIFVIGKNGILLKSTNEGLNWQNIQINSVRDLFNIKFLNNSTGFITGGNIFKTTNNGLTWDSITQNINSKRITFADTYLYYMLSSDGKIFRSTDLGYNWTNLIVYKTQNNLTGLSMINENTGFVIGNNGTLLKTINGNIWDTIITPLNTSFNCIKFFNSNTGIIGCNNRIILKTTNSGQNWDLINPGTSYYNISSFSFPAEGIGFYACWYNLPNVYYYGKIYKTTDYGNTWNQVYSTSDGLVEKIFFSDINTGYAVGTILGMIKTTNSGNNWFSLNLPVNNNYDEVYFLNSSTGFCVSVLQWESKIYKTTNGGFNWTIVDSTNTLYDNGYDPGNFQFINNTTGYLAQIAFPNLGRSGNIMKTTDEGISWFSISNSQYSPLVIGSGLTNIQFINSNTGYVVGENGIILKTTNGGGNFNVSIHPNLSKTLQTFSLSQNYPNPFNPVTKIKFDIPSNVRSRQVGTGSQTANVKIIVYDILGKEIQTLVNEQLQPGSYEVTFDGSNLPSGVYFYQLRAGDFMETKKLILLK